MTYSQIPVALPGKRNVPDDLEVGGPQLLPTAKVNRGRMQQVAVNGGESDGTFWTELTICPFFLPRSGQVCCRMQRYSVASDPCIQGETYVHAEHTRRKFHAHPSVCHLPSFYYYSLLLSLFSCISLLLQTSHRRHRHTPDDRREEYVAQFRVIIILVPSSLQLYRISTPFVALCRVPNLDHFVCLHLTSDLWPPCTEQPCNQSITRYLYLSFMSSASSSTRSIHT